MPFMVTNLIDVERFLEVLDDSIVVVHFRDTNPEQDIVSLMSLSVLEDEFRDLLIVEIEVHDLIECSLLYGVTEVPAFLLAKHGETLEIYFGNNFDILRDRILHYV